MQQRSEETHQRILDAANQLFANKGYNAASVADICQLAGVSKGAFYHHFDSKQAVFLELMERWLAGLEENFRLVLQELDYVPQAIIQMAHMSGSILNSMDVRLSIFLEFWTQAQRDPDIWQVAIAPYRRYQEYFTQLVKKGIQDGSLRDDIDPELASRTLVSLAVGILMQALFDPKATDWGDETENIYRFFMKNLSI